MSSVIVGVAASEEIRKALERTEQLGQLHTVARPALLIRNRTTGSFTAELQLSTTLGSPASASQMKPLFVNLAATPQIHDRRRRDAGDHLGEQRPRGIADAGDAADPGGLVRLIAAVRGVA